LTSETRKGENSSQTENAGTRRLGATLVLLECLSVAAWLAVIVSQPFFPTLDGPGLLYVTDAIRHLLRNPAAYGGAYALGHIVGSHVVFIYLLMGLSVFMGAIAAEKTLIAGYVVAFWLASRYLINSVADGNRNGLSIVCLPFALGAAAYLGFYDFILGVAATLFACGYWIRSTRRWTRWRVAGFLPIGVLLIALHPITTFVFLVFAGIHTLIDQLMEWRGGRFRLRALAAPVLQLFVVGLLLLAATPLPANPDPSSFTAVPIGQRLREIATLRPVCPFESRTYRLALTALCVSAIVILLLTLLRDGRSSLQPAFCALLLSSAAMLGAYLAVPDTIHENAYFLERFAIFAVLFLLAATAIVTASLPRLALIGIGVAVVAYTALFQYSVNREYASQWSQVFQAPVVSHARMGALVLESPDNAELIYGPQQWVGAHYFRRSQLAMLNAPWMGQAGAWLRTTGRYPCQFLNPQDMGTCLEAAAPPPPIDLLVAVRTKAGPASAQTTRIAAKYCLTRQIWAAPLVSIFARPEASTSPAAP